MIFVGQSTDFFTLITKPRCCHRKVNVPLPISNVSFNAASSIQIRGIKTYCPLRHVLIWGY